jgi:hypothetical protein
MGRSKNTAFVFGQTVVKRSRREKSRGACITTKIFFWLAGFAVWHGGGGGFSVFSRFASQAGGTSGKISSGAAG